MEINRINNLSFYNDQGILTIPAKQYDTGRKFTFNILDDDEPFDLSECDVYLRIFKADGTQFQGEECCSITDNTITVDTSVSNGEQILSCVGLNKCELHLESNGKSLTTWDFNIDVIPRVHDGSNIKSIDSWDMWDKIKNDVYDLKVNLSNHIDNKDNPHETTPEQLGLGNVDNTSDIDKPISKAQQNALKEKADIDSPTFTGVPKAPTADIQANDLQIATTAFVKAVINALINGAPETLDTLKELADAIEANEDVVVALNKAIEDKISSSGGTFLKDNSDSSMDIDNKGIRGDGSQTLMYFDDVSADELHGTRIYYNDEDIDDRYVKQEDYTPVDTSNFLSTKSGGTVNNTFRVNKVSTTNPIGVVELEIANDGTVAINGTDEEGKNKKYTSMAYFKVKNTNGYKEREITFNSDVTTINGDLNLGYTSDIYFDVHSSDSIVPNGIYSPNGIVILGSNNGIHLMHSGVTSNAYNGFHIGNDTVSINYKSRNNISKNIDEDDVIAIFDNGDEKKIRMYTPQFQVGVISDPFIECDYYNPTAGLKTMKLRGGTNASILINNDNNIQFGSENGKFIFTNFSNDEEILTINNEGINLANRKIKNTNYIISNTFYMDIEVQAKNPEKNFCSLMIRTDDNKFYLDTNTLDYPVKNIGSDGSKWTNIYATNGVIQTSDKNEKNTILDLELDRARKLIMGAIPKTYRMNDGTAGRTHWGLISQDVEEQLSELGWSSLDFAGFIKSPKTILIREDENGNRLKTLIEQVVEGEYNYSLRYDEFIAPMIKVIQSHEEKIKEQNQTIQSLEERISALEDLLLNK